MSLINNILEKTTIYDLIWKKYKIGTYVVLFLVEKSPVNINCLISCLSAGSKKHRFWEIPWSSHKGWPKGFRHRGTRIWGQILNIWYGSVENQRFSGKPWIFHKDWPKGFSHRETRICRQLIGISLVLLWEIGGLC